MLNLEVNVLLFYCSYIIVFYLFFIMWYVNNVKVIMSNKEFFLAVLKKTNFSLIHTQLKQSNIREVTSSLNNSKGKNHAIVILVNTIRASYARPINGLITRERSERSERAWPFYTYTIGVIFARPTDGLITRGRSERTWPTFRNSRARFSKRRPCALFIHLHHKSQFSKLVSNIHTIFSTYILPCYLQ